MKSGSTPAIRPALPQAPATYDQGTFSRLISDLEIALSQLEGTRRLTASGLQLFKFPEEGVDLAEGQVFINGDGLLQVVRAKDVFVSSVSATTALGSVTVVV